MGASLTGRRRAAGLGAALLLMVAIAYSPALRGGFIWDDDDHVSANRTLTEPGGLVRIWTEPRSIPQYYPLVHTTFWLETRLWGRNPLGFHLVNVVLHGANAVLLWILLRGAGVPGAFLAAAVFALHPVHVESVAWVTERKNVLSGLFYLGAALAWQRFRPSLGSEDARGAAGRQRWYLLALALFVCALLSKTVTATWPAAMLVLLWWKRGAVTWRDVLRLTPFFALGAGFGLMTARLEVTHVLASGPDWALSFPERVLIAGRALWFYASKLVWPVGLAFIYPRWRIDAADPVQWLWPAAAVVVVIALWLARDRIGRAPLAGVLFFGGTLFPALGFLDFYPMLFSYVADHFQYLGSIGLTTLAAGWAAGTFGGGGEGGDRGQARTAGGAAALGSACALLLVLGALTWRQARNYADPETLWRDTIDKNPAAWLARNNLGSLLKDSGRNDEAVRQLEESIRLYPGNYRAHHSLGRLFTGQGRVAEAEAHFRAAISASGGRYAKAMNDLGVLLVRRGAFEEAVSTFRLAAAADPGDPTARANLAETAKYLAQRPGGGARR